MADDAPARPWNLTWADVDPQRRGPVSADASRAFEIALPLVPPRPRGKQAVDPSFEEAIDQALVAALGPWACGWRWARDEGSIGGGPVSAWCCAAHSLGAPDATARKVAAAVEEWGTWLQRLATRFAELDANVATGDDVIAAFEQATAVLVADVVEQTHAGDAWYTHCAQVLTWYLERRGLAGATAAAMVDAAIGGRFQSWVGPNPDELSAVASALGGAVVEHLTS